MKKILLLLTVSTLMSSSASWSMSDLEEGTIYKIRNLHSRNVLHSFGSETGKQSVTMEGDFNDDHPCASWGLWRLHKHGGCYKISNVHSGNFLNGWDMEVGPGTITMENDVADNYWYASHRLWAIEKGRDNYQIKNFHSGNLLKGGEQHEIGKGSAGMELNNGAPQFENHKLWSFIPIYVKVQ